MRILVNGASGGVGTFALQMAKALGTHVTGICSARHLSAAKEIGADHIIDYNTQDSTETDNQYDAIIDVVANRNIRHLRRILRESRTIAPVSFSTMGHMATTAMAASHKRSRKPVVMATADNSRTDDLIKLSEMTNSGIGHPVIDRSFPIDQTANAFHYLKSGVANEKVIVQVT